MVLVTATSQDVASDSSASVAGRSIVHLESPEERAQFLMRLKPHIAQFSEEDRAAYNTFRDELMRFAREGGSLDSLYTHAAVLSAYAFAVPSDVLTEIPETVLPAPQKEEVSAEEVVPEVAPSVADVAEEQDESETSALSSMDETVVPEEVAVPVSASVISAARRPSGRRGPDVRIPALAVSQEMFSMEDPEPPHPLVVELTAMQSGAPKEAPLPEEVTLTSLQEKVHRINEDLNTFAHGKAFQWLSDTSTGYREYMNALIALRENLHTPSAASSEVLPGLEGRVVELGHMADGVRAAVGESAPSEPQTTAWAESTAPAAEISGAPIEKSESEVTRLSVMPAQEEILVAPLVTEGVLPPVVPEMQESPVSQEGIPSVQEESTPAPSEVGFAESVLPPLMQKSPRVFENTAPDILSGASPSEQPITVPVAAPAPTSLDLSAPLAPAAPVAPEVMHIPAAENFAPVSLEKRSEEDVLFSTTINTGLNNLLIKWLGSTGFLGFGASGAEHPDWLVLRELYVEDVCTDDGTIPKGLRADTMTNVRANIKAWSDKYGLVIEGPTETVEHFMRRVVRASIAS